MVKRGFIRGFNYGFSTGAIPAGLLLIMGFYYAYNSPNTNQGPILIGYLIWSLIAFIAMGVPMGLLAGYQMTEQTIQVPITNEKEFMFKLTLILGDLNLKQVSEATTHITFDNFWNPNAPIRIKIDSNIATIVGTRVLIRRIQKELHSSSDKMPIVRSAEQLSNPQQPPPPCPKCNSGMQYVQQYQKWYCSKCNSYS